MKIVLFEMNLTKDCIRIKNSTIIRRLTNNKTNKFWFVIRDNGLELEVNLNYGIKSKGKHNPVLRQEEIKVFNKILKNHQL